MAEELERKSIAEAYDKMVENGRLQVCSVVEIEPGVIQVGQPAEITFLIDVEPEITLPEYRGITVMVPPAQVTDEEVGKALYTLRSQRADFKKKATPAEESDYLMVSYEGRLEGRPLEEIVPDQPLLARQSQSWEEASPERADFPGLAEQLIGLAAGEKKEITVDFADNLEVEALRGKSVQYAVEVFEVREKILPELDEDLLKTFQVESAEELKESIRADLTNRLEKEKQRIMREQVLNFLVENTAFDLPQSAVDEESEYMFQTLLERRWTPRAAEDNPEAFEAELREDAAKEARRRVTINRIIRKIAEVEHIHPEQEDFQNLILMEAIQTQQKPEKIAKALQKDRARMRSMQESILFNKTLDFLVEQSTVAKNKGIVE